jgi:large subunit ribosomal protein L18
MTHARHILPYRRKREGRTNYKKRLNLLKSGKRRLVIRLSNRHLQLQVVEYQPDGDRVLVTVNSKALTKQGWSHSTKSTPAAYCTGFLLGKAALQHHIDEAIVDLGLQKHRHGTRICAAIKGAVDAGLTVPVGEDIFPGPERIRGEHLTTAKQEEVAALAAKLGITLPTGSSPKKEKATKEEPKKDGSKGEGQKKKEENKGAEQQRGSERSPARPNSKQPPPKPAALQQPKQSE